MKTGRTLTELAVELDRQRKNMVDYLVDTRDMRMDMNGRNGQLSLTNREKGTVAILGVNEIAHDQIGTTFGIPSKYYERMRAENPELLAANVNSWFEKEPKLRMVRSLDGNARAFLSERYRRIDNWDIADVSLSLLNDVSGLYVESCQVTDERLYIKVVNQRLTKEIAPGDIVQSGILITNSEVGKGSVAVQPLVYRLVCSNGLVVNDAAIRKNHVGRGNVQGEDFTLYSDETLKLSDMALMSKVRDTVRSVIDFAKFDKVVEMMQDAKDAKITSTKIPQMVELVGSEFGYTKKEGESILNKLICGCDYSLYGLVNAVTAAAQNVESYDRSTELESVGYDILSMSTGKWNMLNEKSMEKVTL